VRRLVYGTAARDDLLHILTYITREARDRNVGAAFVDKLRAQCVKLSQLDGTLGTARPELRADIRSTPCQGYVIFFRYRADDVVEIVNILHGSRDIDHYFEG
jgi:toxin ParE1/3/4